MMKRVMFKKSFTIKNVSKKNKVIIFLLFTVFLITFFTKKITSTISYNLTTYLQEKVKKENQIILKNSFSYLNKEEVNLDKLMTVIKNSKEEIIEVDFNIKECTAILTNISSYINDSLSDYNYFGYRLDIPAGIITNNFIFRNLGPKIPIKVEVADVALGNVSSQVKEFGINNALIEIHISITINTSILYPFDTISSSTKYETLIASKIITGEVPGFYNGSINSKTDTISLPLNE